MYRNIRRQQPQVTLASSIVELFKAVERPLNATQRNRSASTAITVDATIAMWHIDACAGLNSRIEFICQHLFLPYDDEHNMTRDPQTSGQQTPSTPELTASETPTYSKTNTLVITSLPPSFFAPLVLEALRIHFESYGEIHTWAPLRAFARIMVVYYDEEAVELAKETCDNLRVEETDAR